MLLSFSNAAPALWAAWPQMPENEKLWSMLPKAWATSASSLTTESRTLFMSGYADHAIVQQGMLDAGTAFLQKPFTPSALGKKIRDVLDAAVSVS